MPERHGFPQDFGREYATTRVLGARRSEAMVEIGVE
jgi:hypothetical protein